MESNSALRRLWSKQIGSFPEFALCCACATGEDALRLIPQESPDVVLMDIVLPRMSGIECTGRLKALLPRLHVVILTTRVDRELVFMALEAGADGYLLKRTKPDDVRLALLDVLQGGAPMTSQIARCVVESFRRKGSNFDSPTRLSLKEEWILMLLCEGHANRLIASKLDLSINTVASHIKRVFRKLEVTSRTEAVVRYLSLKPPRQAGEVAGWP